MNCNYEIRKEGDKRIAILNCEECENASSLMDEACRQGIIEILKKEADIGRLLLQHPFVKVFDGHALELMKSLAIFVEGISSVDVVGGEDK
ncbi:MAG: hypothetical protein DRN29_01330, partial [Thermoplasmata archaeon]